MEINGVHFPDGRIAEFCRRHGVKKLSLFGSILRESVPAIPGGPGALGAPGDEHAFRPNSDIDILVEFLPGEIKSLFDLGGMLMELREMLGRDVDLRTPMDLSRYFRHQVLREARPLYAA